MTNSLSVSELGQVIANAKANLNSNNLDAVKESLSEGVTCIRPDE